MHTVELIFTAQEILVGYSDTRPSRSVRTAKAYRELGIGYANLGALLMASACPTTPTKAGPWPRPSPP